MASESNESLPNREQLLKAVEATQAAHRAQSMANDLKSKAKSITDGGEREKLLKEAYEKEVEAHGLSNTAKRMQSGVWQGFGFGGGIGAATGLGLGAGLGTLLGAVTAIPATGIGMLVGAGVGAVHGPWIKLGGKEQKFEDANAEEIVDELQKEQDSQRLTDIEKRATDAEHVTDATDQNQQTPRRKPPKLEIRSQRNSKSQEEKNISSEKPSSTENNVSEQQSRRKPKKLEVRSVKAESLNGSNHGR